MSSTVKGMVFNIQKLSVHDGPGIRTTVFLKGCPLNCLWCHNPESKAKGAELLFHQKLCIGCRSCQAVCPSGCHTFTGDSHFLNRDHCSLCKKCIQECVGALEIIGREMTSDEVMEEVLKDRKFYEQSNGGMTISGGEPLSQHAFTQKLLLEAKKNALHTCVETCGYTEFSKLKAMIGNVDLFLYDWKETNDTLHQKFTGVSNQRIVNNLLGLDEAGAKIILRCPIIPGLNDREEHFSGIADIANRCNNIVEVDIEPYHRLGESKHDSIGYTCTKIEIPVPSEDEIELWVNQVQKKTKVPVERA